MVKDVQGFSLSWPAVGSLLAGAANVYLFRYLLRYRAEPGARWFLAVIGCQVLWSVGYGVALLVFNPMLRLVLEFPVWIAVNWIGVFYLGFALEYTGRVDLLRSAWFKSLVAFEIASTVIVLTNPLHHFVWENFTVAPMFGAATVTYTHEPWMFVQYAAIFGMTSIGVMVLLDTVISYGPLYRRQAFAIVLTVVPPAAAYSLWMFELEPVYPLDLTPFMFVPHVALDLYALFRSDMFEFLPTTRRTAERAAIDDLGTPVVILDQRSRVVNLNAASRERFGLDKQAALGRDLDGLYDGTTVDPTKGQQDVTIRHGGRKREYTVIPSELTDTAGTHVGYTVVFQEVTAERQRKQRLDVLNRVLRHNLGNSMSIVTGHAEALAVELDEPEKEFAEQISDTASELVELGGKARLAADVVETDRPDEEVELAALVEDLANDLSRTYPGASIDVELPSTLRLVSDARLLKLVFENLIENGIVHDDDPPAHVALALGDDTGDDHSVEVVVRDDGPGIPPHEIQVVQTGEESALEHGSGLGLWLVRWGVTILGGDLGFESDGDRGTVVRVRLPGVQNGT